LPNRELFDEKFDELKAKIDGIISDLQLK